MKIKKKKIKAAALSICAACCIYPYTASGNFGGIEAYAFEGVYDPVTDREKLGEKTGPGILEKENSDNASGEAAAGSAEPASQTARFVTHTETGRPFEFGSIMGRSFANSWADMRLGIPTGFTAQTGKELYGEIYYEPQDAVYDAGQATDILIVSPEYMKAYAEDTVYDLNDCMIFTLCYMPVTDQSAEGLKLNEDKYGTAVAQAILSTKGYDAYVEKGQKEIGGYTYNSYRLDYGYAVKARYMAENPGKESPLLEDDIRAEVEIYMRTSGDKEIIILTFKTGKYYGGEDRIISSIEKCN